MTKIADMATRIRTIVPAAIAIVALSACSSSGAQDTEADAPKIASSSTATSNGMTITDEMIGRSRGTMALSRVSSDRAYGYGEKQPVLVGGGFDQGSDRTYQYLNTLRGPNGEPVVYSRIGTCCSFKSPNSPFGGAALLEVYEIKVGGSSEPRRLYFNWYDSGEVFVPVGLTAAH
jgi:hypothetical protein